MSDIFTGIGFATVALFCITIFCCVIDFILNGIRKAVLVYKYRHRFDKPPTAACYCIDCKFHGDDTDPSRCTRRADIIFQTAYEWFCSFAEPKERGK